MKVKFWGVRGSVPSAIKGISIRNKIKKILTLAKPSDLLDENSIENFINSLPFSLTHTFGGNTTCLYQNNLEFLIKKEKVVDYFNRKNIIYYFKKGSY